MKQNLDHNRHIGYYAASSADQMYENARRTPTAKQKKFFVKLVMMCKDHGIDPAIGHSVHSRIEYADAIDILIKRLRENGVENIHGNGVEFDTVITIENDDDTRSVKMKERLVPKNRRVSQAEEYAMNAAVRYKKTFA